ncbi:MAG: DUF917 domain-containing protein [Pseudomonadota bacterium]
MSDGYPLTEADLPALRLGAALLGTGGGGNPYIGMLRTRELLRAGATVEVRSLESFEDDELIGSVGGIGAPVVGVEKVEEGEECLRALRAVEDAVGTKVSALISAEIGGANAMEPVLTAAQAGVPVADGDGMGRAFPEVQMTTFFIYGQQPEPAAIADEKGNCIVYKDMVDMYWLESFARNTVVVMGAGAGFATAPMKAGFLKKYAVPGTVTQALNIGRAIEQARASRRDVLGKVAEASGGKIIYTGKIGDVRRELKGGFAMGHVELSGVGDHTGEAGRIAIQNENLIFWRDGNVEITVPDLLMILELDTAEPITTELLRYGQRVAVLAMPAHPLMKSPEALKVVGPEAFGYADIAYKPFAA